MSLAELPPALTRTPSRTLQGLAPVALCPVGLRLPRGWTSDAPLEILVRGQAQRVVVPPALETNVRLAARFQTAHLNRYDLTLHVSRRARKVHALYFTARPMPEPTATHDEHTTAAPEPSHHPAMTKRDEILASVLREFPPQPGRVPLRPKLFLRQLQQAYQGTHLLLELGAAQPALA
ncbi:hypothetical protein [Deinococcus multiflagellatus]|uniref:Uncharacterized protein n=1 Tax=Deinococcus multiflagellatus TaxID=1656887 RepID=A0ABW1ZPJ8_9DEIO